MKHLLVRLLGMPLILAATSASPAFAANELGLSVDGVHWVKSIDSPLFDESMRWVPGDSEATTFFVRNQGGSSGDLTVDVLGSGLGNLIDSGDFHVTAKGGGGQWTTVSEDGTHSLLSAPNIPNGKVEPIHVRVAFDFSSPNQTQVESSDANFRVTLSESAETGSSSAGGNLSETELPGTGAPHVLWFAAIGAILIGVGLAFVTRRREETERSSHV